MRIAIAQVNATVGDLEGNVGQCVEAIINVLPQYPDLIVFPEMVIPGYPPRDILYDPGFVNAVQAANIDLAQAISDAEYHEGDNRE